MITCDQSVHTASDINTSYYNYEAINFDNVAHHDTFSSRVTHTA